MFLSPVCVCSGDGASSVCSGGSDELTKEEMDEAIMIREEIENTGMYFA